MKLSITKTLCDGPTLRQNAVGIPGGSTRTYSTCRFGRRIDEVDRAFGGVGVETVVEGRREPSRDDRGAGKAMGPGDRHAFRVETGGQPVEPIGRYMSCWMSSSRVQTTLTGPSTCLRDLDGASDAVDLEPAAEAAADQMIVHDDLLQRQAGGLRGRRPGRAPGPGCRPRSRSRPGGHEPCSSSAPSWRAPGTAPGRSPRPWWRRLPSRASASPIVLRNSARPERRLFELGDDRSAC